MTTILSCVAILLRGNAGQRSMRESNRCDGAQCAHQFFENARPHRVARTRSCSLSPAFSVLNFLLVRVFSPKISVVVVVILVIVVGVFDHSDVQTAVVVVF